MTKQGTRAVLQTFAEKLDRLENSSLMRSLSSDGWKLSWDFEANRPAGDARTPDVEHLEAYILNLRFFIQNNEPTSLRNMGELYRLECKNADLRNRFQEVRDAMNGALDQEVWFRFNDQPMTYRMLFEGMVYARFAHANKNRHELFDQMAGQPFGSAMAMNEFLKCLCVVHTALVFINKLNTAAFPDP